MGKYKVVNQCNKCGKIFDLHTPLCCPKCGQQLRVLNKDSKLYFVYGAVNTLIAKRVFFKWKIKSEFK